MLEIASFVLGPVSTNVYLVADSGTGAAGVIDPAWDGAVILAEAKKRGWRIGQVWCTHAHFDHIGAVGDLARGLEPPPIIALHASCGRAEAVHPSLVFPCRPALRPLWSSPMA